MGRVSKYKKVKHFDRLGKKVNSGKVMGQGWNEEYVWGTYIGQKIKTKSLTVRQQKKKHLEKKSKKNNYINSNIVEDNVNFFDIPSGKDDYEINDIVGSLKKEMPVSIMDLTTHESSKRILDSSSLPPPAIVNSHPVDISGVSVSYNIPFKENEEKSMYTKIFTKPSRMKDEKNITGLKPGESMNAFRRRMKEETRLAIIRDNHTNRIHRINPEKKERRKKFLQQKKLIKKNRKRLRNSTNNDFKYDESAISVIDTEKNNEKENVCFPSRTTLIDPVKKPPNIGIFTRPMEKKFNKKNLKIGKFLNDENNITEIKRKVKKMYAMIKAKRRENRILHA